MLKKPWHTWMELILTGKLFKLNSHYLSRRRFLHLPKLLSLLQGEMLPRLIVLVLILKKMDKAVVTTSRRDAPKTDSLGADIEKDGQKRQRDSSTRRKPLSPLRRRSPLGRRGSPRRELDSPVRRRINSPIRRGDSPPPRRRPASPTRGRSPSPPRRYNRSPPRASPQRMRGPVRRCSPPFPRRRSPRRFRSPLRRSPNPRRLSRSPLRRPAFSLSRSISPRRLFIIDRGRATPARRGRSSSNSGSPVPRKVVRKISRSRSPRRRERSSSNSSSSSSLPRKP